MSASQPVFKRITAEVLEIDAERATTEIVDALRDVVGRELRRRGGVIALSGGVDSAVTTALCARAFGPERTLAVLMPETESDDETLDLSRSTAVALGVESVEEPITETLKALGCYERRTDVVRALIPQFTDAWKWKVVLPSLVGNDLYRVSFLVAQSQEGEIVKVRLPAESYRAIVAATNFKQRVRKTLEYFHADRLHYAVLGTPNRLEYDQGFFVKAGDGAADAKPIAHLYKSQVYSLAEYLGVPATVRDREPTTDTYSLAQSQEEFYFSLPYDKLDLCLYAHNSGLPPEAVADAVDLDPSDVDRVFRDIEQKRRTTRYLHLQPFLAAPVPEISH